MAASAAIRACFGSSAGASSDWRKAAIAAFSAGPVPGARPNDRPDRRFKRCIRHSRSPPSGTASCGHCSRRRSLAMHLMTSGSRATCRADAGAQDCPPERSARQCIGDLGFPQAPDASKQPVPARTGPRIIRAARPCSAKASAAVPQLDRTDPASGRWKTRAQAF